MDINKLDAQFIALNYDELKNYNICGVSKMENPMINVLLSENIDININGIKNKIISTIISNKSVFIDSLKGKIADEIDDVCTNAAEHYFESALYPNNDVMEDVIENQNSEVKIDLIDEIEYIMQDDTCNKTIINLLHVIKEINCKDKNFSDDIKKSINDMLYISYHPGMYLNADGEDVESEISIETEFDYESIMKDVELIEEAENDN